MSDSDSADLEYKQRMESQQSQRFVRENAEALSGAPVRLEASIPPKTAPDMNAGNRRSDAELAAMGLDYSKIPKPTLPTPQQESLQTPGGSVVNDTLSAVGKAGKAAVAAASPVLDVAGKALGLDLPRGGAGEAASFVTGLPGQDMSDAQAGTATALTLLPGLGMVNRAVSGGAKVAEKALTLNQALKSSVLTTASQNQEYLQVPLTKGAFALRESDHMNSTGANPLDPAKVKAIQEQLKKGELSTLPPVDMTVDPATGEMRLLDGRHRIAAAQAQGYTSITAKVLTEKPKPFDTQAVTQLAEESANDLYTRGGSTYSLTKGNQYTQPSYAVNVHPELIASVPGHATPKDIGNYVKSLDGKVDLNNDLYSVGTHFNKATGQTELGVSLTLNTLDDALAVAKAGKQASIYSLGSGQEIFTGLRPLQPGENPLSQAARSTPDGTVFENLKGRNGPYTVTKVGPGIKWNISKDGKHLDQIAANSPQEAVKKFSDFDTWVNETASIKAGGQSGKVNLQAAVTLATAMAGGAFGYAVGADDEKVTSALVGAGLGFLAPLAIPLAKAMIRSKLGKAPALGEAALTKAEQASPLADIAKQYRARVEEMRRGVRPHAQAREEGARALAAGDLSDEYLMTRNPGATYNDNTIAAMKEVLTQEGQKLQNFAGAYMLNPSNKAVEEAFLKQFATYAKIDPLDVGLEAEAGRSLGYLNDVENEINRFTRNMSGVVGKVRATQSPLRMAQMVAATPTLSQLSDFTRRATAPGLSDMVAESWINGLLSQPITHVTNSVSNLLTVLTSVPERAIAQGFGALTGGPGGVVAGETSALTRGYLNSVQGAWLTAAKAFRTDTPQFGSGKMEVRNQAISQHNFDMMLQRTGIDPLVGSWTKAFDYIGTAARVPGRLLLAEDEFFKAIAFGGESSAQAWRSASLEVGSSGATGRTLKDGINQRYNDIMADPAQLSAFAHDAEQFASYVTFTKDLGEVGQTLQKLSSHPLGRYIAPFMRTPINIAKYAGERTPFALLSANVRDDIAKGGATRDLALAKLATGSSAMATFATLSAAGVLTGFGPADKETRALWQTDGRKPYNINISGLKRLASGGDPSPQTGDDWRGYSRIDPVGMLIGLSADTTDILMNTDDPEVADHLGARLTLVASHVIASKTYVKGVAEWMFAAADPEHYGGKLEESLARTLVTAVPVLGPAAKFTQRLTDPLVRETNGVIDAIKSTIPGLSNTLYPKRNHWGEVQLKEGWQVAGLGVESAFSPFYRSTAIKDNVVKRIVDCKVNLTDPRDTIGKVKLNPEQYDYLRAQFGTVTAGGMNDHQALESIMAKFPDNTTDPQSTLHLLLKSREDVYKNLAREALYKQFPALRLATGQLTAQEKMKSRALPPPPRGVSEITVE